MIIQMLIIRIVIIKRIVIMTIKWSDDRIITEYSDNIIIEWYKMIIW